MSEREYLTTVAEVLAIHSVLVEPYGGTPGMRDSAALESAVFRPKTNYYSDIVAATEYVGNLSAIKIANGRTY